MSDTERSGTGAANATTVGLRTVSPNICGDLCNNGKTDKLPYIPEQIDNYAPHLVMMQEVCRSQSEWFKGHRFTSGTYQFEFTPLLTNYSKCAGGADCTVNEDSDPANDNKLCEVGQVLGARGVLSNTDKIDLGGERRAGLGRVPKPTTTTRTSGSCRTRTVSWARTRAAEAVNQPWSTSRPPRSTTPSTTTSSAPSSGSTRDGQDAH
ncbi:hypothetical protein ACIG0D_26115 [Streptomyces sp. NPDC052773]|uniref:hypothetical protein n=1 Tax=Streptomyces sp. NPDC052773 TaxID=3365693 RepID=UPI0037CE5B52